MEIVHTDARVSGNRKLPEWWEEIKACLLFILLLIGLGNSMSFGINYKAK